MVLMEVMVMLAAKAGGCASMETVVSMVRTLVALATVTITSREITAIAVVRLVRTSYRGSLHSRLRKHSGPVFLHA